MTNLTALDIVHTNTRVLFLLLFFTEHNMAVVASGLHHQACKR